MDFMNEFNVYISGIHFMNVVHVYISRLYLINVLHECILRMYLMYVFRECISCMYFINIDQTKINPSLLCIFMQAPPLSPCLFIVNPNSKFIYVHS